jgi:hypothetical protein
MAGRLASSSRTEEENLMKRLLPVLAVACIALVGGVSAAFAKGAGGVTAPSIYVNGVLYRTVGTPTDFSNTGAPDSSFETIYDFGGVQPNVAEAAPGDPGFRGGRWQVHALSFNMSYAVTVAAHDTNGSGNLDSTAEIDAALADPGPGGATDFGVVKLFECPVIPAH